MTHDLKDDLSQPDPLTGAVGLRVRNLRKEKEWTVNELALRSGLSTGIVSQIERNKANPSLKTLERIRKALGVTLSALLEDNTPSVADDAPFVRRAGDRPHFEVGRGSLSQQLLSPRDDQVLQFMIITFPPGSKSEEVVTGVGEKAGLVLHGKVKLIVGANRADLMEGDSFQFDSSADHQVINPHDERAEILWIMAQSPPVKHL